MKPIKVFQIALLTAILSALAVGCTSLFPKKVELFQKKVPDMPAVTQKAEETQRQAADYVATKTEEAKVEAIKADSPTNIVQPITEAHVVADALSTSLGPPDDPWRKEAVALATKLTKQTAQYNSELEAYRKRIVALEGKKIEGTGLIQIGYFTYIGLILGGIVLIYFGLRIYGLFNPVVGLAGSTIGRVSSSVLTKGFSEIVAGGQQFLNWVENSNLPQETVDWVTNAFKLAQQTKQSASTQQVISNLVTPATSSVQPLNPPAVPASSPSATGPLGPS